MTTRIPRLRLLLAIALTAAVLGPAGCKTAPPEEPKPPEKPKAETTGPHAALLRLFPAAQDTTDWKADEAPRIFGPQPGPAEGVEAVEADMGRDAALVRAYDYVKSATRRYTRGTGGETVTLRVFEMRSPAEAFGLFTIRSAGTQFPLVGSALVARMSSNVLTFVKGPYFVTVEYKGTSDPAPAVMEIGRHVAEQIPLPGYQPAVLASFPPGSVQGERYFLHTFDVLEALPFVPKGDSAMLRRLLALGPQTDVAVVGYATTTPGVLNYLFIIRYPTAEEALAAYTAYDGYLLNSTHPAEMNVAVAPPVRAYLTGTFNAEENSVKDRLAELLAGLGG